MVVAKRWRNRCDSGTPDVGTVGKVVELDIWRFVAESGAGTCEILSKAQQNEVMQPPDLPDLALLDCSHFVLFSRTSARKMPASLLHLPGPLQLPLPLRDSNGGGLWTCSVHFLDENIVGACKASALSLEAGLLGSASVVFFFSFVLREGTQKKHTKTIQRIAAAACWLSSPGEERHPLQTSWSSTSPKLRFFSLCRILRQGFPKSFFFFFLQCSQVVINKVTNPFGYRAAEASGQCAPWFMHRSVEKMKFVKRLVTKHFQWVVQIEPFYSKMCLETWG